MGWHGYWASPGDWQRHHSHQPGHQRNSLSVSTSVHSPAAEKCGLLPQHNEHRIISRCSRCLTFCLVFTSAALCWWAKNNNNSRISIAQYDRNFRGAGGRSDQCSVKAWLNRIVLSLNLKTVRQSMMRTAVESQSNRSFNHRLIYTALFHHVEVYY